MEFKFTLALDASQFKQYMTCSQSWYYSYQENLRLQTTDTEAMDKGTLVHNLMDIYYNLIAQSPNCNKNDAAEGAIEFFKKSKVVESMGFPQDTEKFIVARFAQYLFFYGNNDFTPILAGGVPSVELGFSKILYENDDVCFIVEGRIDLIARLGDQLVFIDHKTESQAGDLYSYKPQFRTYAWATGLKYGGVNYFGMQKEVGAKTFRRQIIEFPEHIVEEWRLKMLSIFWEISISFQDKDLCDTKNIEYKYRRNLASCAGPYEKHPCQFTHLCETKDNEMRENIKQFKYKVSEPWQPWKLK